MATSEIQCEFDRAKELKEFDDTKSGVKGLVDAGVNTVPRIFLNQPDELSMMSGDDHFQVPIIDLQGIQSSGDRRSKIIKQIIDASESWGFFQLVNHGIPLGLLDRLIQGVRLFHEQDPELKKEFYSRDPMKMVKFNSNLDLFRSNNANWRDTLTVLTRYTGHLDPTELPDLCRDVILEYASEATKLADSLLDLMSEGLGLTSAENQLGGMECTKGWTCVYHYYPSCPAPDVTLGATKHTDPSFLTALLQDEIGGLQVLHQNKWVNVHPVPGALVINIGDLLQMISNDKMKSIEHRVVANRVGPRISAAMFFNGLTPSPRIYGPVKELVSAENPALYKEFTLATHSLSTSSSSLCTVPAQNWSSMALNDIHCEYNRAKELKEFDETKSGVKGLMDAGANTVPRIFIRPPEELHMIEGDDRFQVPLIDLQGIQSSADLRSKIIKQILDASEEWGFFQLVNHGIPLELLNELIQRIRLFHEQDPEKRKEYYSRDRTKTVMFNSNNDLFKSKTANWRDTLTVFNQYTGHLDPTQLPDICRDVIVKYTNEATKLADTLLDLMSEGLGLTSAENQLGGMECTKGWDSVYHYYPACPEPRMTLGNPKHTDPSFLTVLLQDEIGGLQVLHEDRWVNVHPVPGSLVINIGDLLQMISNDKLKSVEHRVVTNRAGPRISAAIFFTGLNSSPKVYGPIKELVSAENPALYKEFTLAEFYKSFFSRSIGEARFGIFKV